MEQFVVERVRQVGRDPRVLKATLAADREARDARRPELEAGARRLSHERGRLETEDLRHALEEFEAVWAELTAAERSRALALLLEKVVFDPESGEVELRFRSGGPRMLREGAG